MQKKRLLKLAKFLRTVPKENFNIESWAEFKNNSKKLGGCGTTACALGWAPTCFPRSKLKLHMGLVDDEDSDEPKMEGYVSYGKQTKTHFTKIDYYDTSVHAAMTFFGLSYEEACYIFTEAPYGSTANDIADRIEAFVKHEGIY